MWPRANLKQQFVGKLWLDVLSKADLLEEEFDAVDEQATARRHTQATSQAGLDTGSPRTEGTEVSPTAEEQASATSWGGWQAASWEDGGGGGGGGGAVEVTTAEQMAAALPHALRVSSVTSVGLDTLKVQGLGLGLGLGTLILRGFGA